jgi:HlyD family secretion protein
MSLFSRSVRVLRKAVLFVALIGLVGGAAWGIWQWRARGDREVRYRTEKVTRGRIASLINASGTLVPEALIDVGAQVAGKIVSFGEDPDVSGKPIDYGTRVVKDKTVLARIDDSLYQTELSIAEAELAVAKAERQKAKYDLEAARARSTQATSDLDRARRSRASVAASELDNLVQLSHTAKATVTGAEAGLLRAEKNIQRALKVVDRAKTNLAYTVITSPVDGVIIDRRVNIGQTVVASLNAPSLFLIAKDLRKMRVWASVNEADVGRIHVGQPVAFKVDTFPDEVFAGVVSQVRLNASMNQNVVTYTVVVNTDNENLKLLPYLTANLQFRTQERDNALLVPNAALRYRPAPERVHPDYLDAYLAGRGRKQAVSELKPGPIKGDNVGTVWVQDEEGELRPIKVRTGLTNGTVTEVLAVLDG